MRLKRSRTQAGQEAPSPPEHRHRRTASPIERLHFGLVLPGGTMFRTTKQSEVSPGATGGGTPAKVTAVDVMRARLRVQSQSAAAVLGAFVMAPAVGAKNVQAEVVLGVAPDGVCVVGAALGVVPLEQQARALHAVIVRRTGLGRA